MLRKMRRGISALLLLALLLTLCACEEKAAGEGTLALYTTKSADSWWDSSAWSNSIEQFQKANKDITVNVVTFDSVEALELQLAADLSSGGGPDVVLYSELADTLDMPRMALNGAFLPLDDYLESDETYKTEGYYAALQQAGVIDGQQLIMPIAFVVPMMITTQEKLDAAGITIPEEGFTMREFLLAVEAEAQRLAGEDNYAFFDLQRTMNMYYAWEYSNIFKIDYSNKTLSVDKNDLKELVDLCEVMWAESVTLWETLMNTQYDYPYDKITFGVFNLGVLGNIANARARLSRSENQTPIHFGLSTYSDAGEYKAMIYLQAAINKNTKAPDTAYQFIRYLMDTTIFQGTEKSSVFHYSLNKAALGSYLSISTDAMGGGTYAKSELTKIIPEFEDMLDHMIANPIISLPLLKILKDSLTPYLEGTDSFDNCYDDLLNRVNIYLNE